MALATRLRCFCFERMSFNFFFRSSLSRRLATDECVLQFLQTFEFLLRPLTTIVSIEGIELVVVLRLEKIVLLLQVVLRQPFGFALPAYVGDFTIEFRAQPFLLLGQFVSTIRWRDVDQLLSQPLDLLLKQLHMGVAWVFVDARLVLDVLRSIRI